MDFVAMADIRKYKITSLTTNSDGNLFIFILTSDVERLSNIRATIQIIESAHRYSVSSTVDSMSIRSAVPVLTQTHIERECLIIIKKMLKTEAKSEK